MDTANVLAGSRLFQGLQPEDLRGLASRARVREFAAGETVISEGEAGGSAFLIADGVVEVLHTGAGGTPQVIATLSPPEFFGEMSLVDWEPRSATVRAKTAATLIEVTMDDLELLRDVAHDSYDVVLLNVARVMSLRLRSTTARAF
jgi:CRP/FNR family cyclic AMP-dependent transcriptional regulator